MLFVLQNARQLFPRDECPISLWARRRWIIKCNNHCKYVGNSHKKKLNYLYSFRCFYYYEPNYLKITIYKQKPFNIIKKKHIIQFVKMLEIKSISGQLINLKQNEMSRWNSSKLRLMIARRRGWKFLKSLKHLAREWLCCPRPVPMDSRLTTSASLHTIKVFLDMF